MKRASIPLCTLLLVAAATIASPTSAAERPSNGDRVRVHVADGGTVVGRLVSWNDDTLVVQGRHHRMMTFPTESVSGVDRSTSRTNHAGGGALIGLGTGLTIGVLAMTAGDAENSFWPTETDGKVAATVLMGAMFTLVGATIGTFLVSDQWSPVDSGSLSLEATPDASSNARVAVAWTVDF